MQSMNHRLESETRHRCWNVELRHDHHQTHSSGRYSVGVKPCFVLAPRIGEPNRFPQLLNHSSKVHRRTGRQHRGGGGVSPSHAPSPWKRLNRSEGEKPDLTRSFSPKSRPSPPLSLLVSRRCSMERKWFSSSNLELSSRKTQNTEHIDT